MIKWLKDRKEKREAAELAIAQAEYDAEVKRLAEIKAGNLADYTQSIKNAMYLQSSINVTTSIVNTAKGKDAAETRRKRDFLRGRIKWMERKLIEETAMVTYYGSLVGI